MAVASSQIDAHITYVDKEDQLLKVYAQIDKDNACCVESLLYRLREVLETNTELKPKTSNDIKVGLVCCAKFEDDIYYRARIESMECMQQYLVTVVFIDHGNRAQINVKDIRLISKLMARFSDKRIPAVLELPGLAEEFYLLGVAPIKKEWDDAALDFLRQRFCNNDLKCAVYETLGKKVIKILEAEYDPCTMLVSLNKAYPIPMGTLERLIQKVNEKKALLSMPEFNKSLPPPTLMQQPPPNRMPNITQPPPGRIITNVNSFSVGQLPPSVPGRVFPSLSVRPGMPIRRPEVSAGPRVQSLQFTTETLAPGVSHPVFVSHVEDGPYSFAVQLQNVVTEVLTQMMADLNNLDPQPITAPLNPGSICLGRYSLDKSLCRAIVMNVLDDKVKLYFADFGNSEILPYSEIYQIPVQFVTPKVMCYRFTLANIKDVHYSELEKQLFKDLVANSRGLVMKVTQPEANPLKQYCELFVNCKNIKTRLQELAQSNPLLRYLPLPCPVKGSQEKVFVSFVLNPGRFFVQLENNSFVLNQMMSCVAKHCITASHIPLVNMRVGESCCALYEDNKWYRAEILKLSPDNKAFINFVDFGNQEEIELANLRQTTPELVTSVKAQALVCCLKGYETRYIVDEEISNRLEELILEKTVTIHVLGSTESNVLIVQITDKSGQDINTLLEARAPQSPIYNEYQATAAPAYSSPPTAKPSRTVTDKGWEEQQSAPTNNSWEDRKYSDSKGPSDDGKKTWRSREDGEVPPRFNKEGGRWNEGSKPERKYGKEGEDKPWNKGDRFSREGGNHEKFNRGDSGGSGRFGRDDNRRTGDRGGKYNDDDKGGRYGRDSESQGGRSGEDRGNRYNKDDGGGKFNRTDDDKPWRKRDDDTTGWRGNRDRDDAGSWKDRDGFSNHKDRESGGNWKDRESGGGGWSKDRGSGGSWNKDRESGSGGYNKDREGWKDGGGDRRSRFDNDGGFKKGGVNRDAPGERSSFRKPWEKGGGDSFSKSTPKSPKLDSVGGMPLHPIKVGASEDTQVVFTTSPAEFYVQVTSSFEELNQLMEKIATACESGEVTDMTSVQEKVGCLAQYSKDDAWYRGFIEGKTVDTANVLFVDYGNKEDITCDKVKNIPEDMCTLPVQAIKCRLLGVPDTVDTDAFTALVDGKTLKTQFVAKHFLTKSFLVVMTDEESGTNINTTMGASEEEIQAACSKMGLVTVVPSKYPAGTILTTQVTWYLSPAEFYLQPMDTNPDFRAMMQQMQSIVRNGSPRQNSQLAVGDFVIARFKSDKVLYRGVVTENDFVVTVQFVDYGNTETVENGKVWAMEPEYATLPVQAFRCALAGVQPVKEAWPKANTSQLDLQFDAETLECTILQLLDDKAQYLVRLTKQGQDVAQNIIEAGFATASSDAADAANELDTTLLVGQQLPVSLLRVEDDNTFFVQPTVENLELQSLEVEGGQGIRCVLSSVKDDASDEERTQFKQLPSGTSVIIQVHVVLSDRLQVTLFDGEGQLLSLQASKTSSVVKLCPMPILNTRQKVWVAHASDDGIFLHKVLFDNILSELLQRLYEFYNESEYLEQEWTKGDICCVRSVNDNQWYRAKILEIQDEIKVQYFDYGNVETLPSSNLRKLDPSFYTPHALALKVSLHVSWSVPLENLLELTGETEYNAVILKNDDGWVVELVDSSGQSLTEKLVELGFAVALENSPFKRVVEGGRFVEGSRIPISVSFIDSPLQLWIFVGDDIELIEALQDRLQEAAPKLPSLKEPSDIFAAKFSDELWYRAVKLDDSTVRFIDYGNSDTVDMSDIKALSADFLEHSEGYAVKVELPVVDFTEGATGRLEELIVSSEIEPEEEIVAHILTVKENSIVADIFKGGRSVVDILVEENLGTRLHQISLGFISHLNSLSDFFLQEAGCEESLEAVANIMLDAENFQPVSQLNDGDIVVALYSEDGLWYRSKVINHADETAEVLFIDYGNSASVSEFRMIPSDLAVKPSLAKHCTLEKPAGVIEWSESANEKFIEMSAGGCTQFEFKVLNKEEPVTVALTYNGRSVSEELKLLCDIVQEITTLETPHLEFSDYSNTVYITHINSPNDFYIQKEEATEQLNQLKKELEDADSFETLEQITDEVKENIIGALIVDDGKWYRVKILNTLDEGFKVLCIDHGNTAIATKFVKLPEALETKSPLAIHCALGKTEWPLEVHDYFAEISGAGSVCFRMKILEEDEPNIISLLLETKIIEEELASLSSVKENIATEDAVPSNTLKNEEMSFGNSEDIDIIKKVYLIQVNSPSDFFLHTAEATQLIEEISERLTAAEDFPLVEETAVSLGEIVAAQFDEDDLWYRARIIDHSENETKVLFIDYGNMAKVARMKNLPEDLVSTPPLAMHCSLQILGGSEWSPKACQTFNTLANDDCVTFDLKIVSEGEPNVVVLYINGESVAEQLVLVSGLVTEEKNTKDEKPFETPLQNYENKGMSFKDSSSETEQEKEVIDKFSSSSFGGVLKNDKENSEDKSNKPNNTSHDDQNNLVVVTISHFNNCSDFYVQLSDDKEELMLVADEMFEGGNFENMFDTEEMLAAKFSADDLWYRAKILDTNKSSSTVLFVDYGNTDVTSEFRKLPKHLAEMKPLAKHCSLKSPRSIWAESTDEKLAALAKIGGFTFDMKVLEEGKPSTVDLFVGGRSLTETFSQQELAEEQTKMGELILQSVGNQITDNVKKEMKEITDELVSNAVGLSESYVPSNELISDSKLKQSENVQTPEIKNELHTMKQDSVNETSPVKSNGIDEEKIEDKAVESQDGVTKDKSPDVESPPTPRRSDIDDHIVPGCISGVQIDNSSEQL